MNDDPTAQSERSPRNNNGMQTTFNCNPINVNTADRWWVVVGINRCHSFNLIANQTRPTVACGERPSAQLCNGSEQASWRAESRVHSKEIMFLGSTPAAERAHTARLAERRFDCASNHTISTSNRSHRISITLQKIPH